MKIFIYIEYAIAVGN